jgi:hypothetical protein
LLAPPSPVARHHARPCSAAPPNSRAAPHAPPSN